MRPSLVRPSACLALAAGALLGPALAQDHQALAEFLRTRANESRWSPRSELLLITAAAKAGLVHGAADIAAAKSLLAAQRSQPPRPAASYPVVSCQGPGPGNPGPSAVRVEVENNDHIGVADPIGSGLTTVTGYLTLDDVDTYRLVVPVDSAVQLQTWGTGATPLADTLLTLTDVDGQLVDQDDDGGPGRTSRIDAQLPAGIYHARVQAGFRAYGGYQLAVTTNPMALPLLTSGQPVHAQFTQATERHTWRLPVGAESALSVGTSGVGGDLMLRLCRSTLSEVHFVDDSSTGGTYPALQTQTTPGVWYLVVQPFPGTTGGAYSLTATWTPQAIPPVPCNSFSTAILAGTESHDVYRLQNHNPPRITLAISGGSAPALSDSVLEIFDQSFARVTYNDDAQGYYSLIDTMLPPGLYYAVVRPYPGDSGGYTLTAACGQPATVNTLPNGRTTATLPRLGGTAAWSYAVDTDAPVAIRTDLAASTISRGLITILDGGGRVKAFDDSTLTFSGNALCGARLATGYYTVLVRDYLAGAGTVDLLVRPSLYTDPRGSAGQLRSLDKAGRVHILFLSNTAGPGIPMGGPISGTLLLNPGSMLLVGAALMGPDGTYLWPFPVGGFGGVAQAIALDLASVTGAMTNLERQ